MTRVRCACRDCGALAVVEYSDAPELCHECLEAGCDESGNCECMRRSAEDFASLARMPATGFDPEIG